ncbi:hypothetical protein VCR6J2_40035 [Vibrio coralliirubri]|nr:hypothetical protein VCR6J2_40035 [Vibrio coralliirubri]
MDNLQQQEAKWGETNRYNAERFWGYSAD